ncbi:MAG: DUF2520 domain-containing protein [Nitrospirae bacterium]|jgi:predicted short-subunit dehydrogenase-like oxidoreductase (DUF2520 family)|nr:DUF2520 domain-containing protein [Nitrospirota bacterium]
MKIVSIIGAGVVGTSLGYLLSKKGYTIAAIASRTIDSANRALEFIGQGYSTTDLADASKKADIVFITTSDKSIKKACDNIAKAGGFKPGTVVFHTCGALSSKVLNSARKQGAYTASFHPLQSLANVKEAVKRLSGSYFFIEGHEKALKTAREIIQALRGKEIRLDINKKTLYHAGACAASNFLVATVGFGIELFEMAGIERKDALRALMPLIHGTVKNIDKLGVPDALTGPIARGDSVIINDHLKSISKIKNELVNLYCELGKYTVKLGIEKGTLKNHDAKKINDIFNLYLKGKKI